MVLMIMVFSLGIWVLASLSTEEGATVRARLVWGTRTLRRCHLLLRTGLPLRHHTFTQQSVTNTARLDPNPFESHPSPEKSARTRAPGSETFDCLELERVPWATWARSWNESGSTGGKRKTGRVVVRRCRRRRRVPCSWG